MGSEQNLAQATPSQLQMLRDELLNPPLPARLDQKQMFRPSLDGVIFKIIGALYAGNKSHPPGQMPPNNNLIQEQLPANFTGGQGDKYYRVRIYGENYESSPYGYEEFWACGPITSITLGIFLQGPDFIVYKLDSYCAKWDIHNSSGAVAVRGRVHDASFSHGGLLKYPVTWKVLDSDYTESDEGTPPPERERIEDKVTPKDVSYTPMISPLGNIPNLDNINNTLDDINGKIGGINDTLNGMNDKLGNLQDTVNNAGSNFDIPAIPNLPTLDIPSLPDIPSVKPDNLSDTFPDIRNDKLPGMSYDTGSLTGYHPNNELGDTTTTANNNPDGTTTAHSTPKNGGKTTTNTGIVTPNINPNEKPDFTPSYQPNPKTGDSTITNKDPKLNPDTSPNTKKKQDDETQTKIDTKITPQPSTYSDVCKAVKECSSGLQDELKDEGKPASNKQLKSVTCDKDKDDKRIENVYTYGGTKFEGIHSHLVALTKMIQDIQDRICLLDDDQLISIPDSWAYKLDGNRPQLVVSYALVNEKNEIDKAHIWSQSIPHFAESKRSLLTKNRPPDYTRGQWQILQVLTDNSKFIMNCKDRNECLRMLQYWKQHIDPKKLQNAPDSKIGERGGDLIKTHKVRAIKAEFYRNGQQTKKKGTQSTLIAPSWVIRWNSN